MERIDFLLAALNQQVETWFPRCSTSDTPNGIETHHGAAGLTEDLKELQQRWEDYLDKNQVLDFATVQKRFLKVQPTLREKLRHVFVDEFQDNNPIQFAIHTGWLANPLMRLTVVGDDDQALYRFRGSDLACFADLGPHCHGRKIAYRQSYNLSNAQAIVEKDRSMARELKGQLHRVIHAMLDRLLKTPPSKHLYLASVHHEGLRNYQDYV